VFLSAGDHASRNGSDVYYKFRPDSNFFYLAGIAEPNYGLLLDTETGAVPPARCRPASTAAALRVHWRTHTPPSPGLSGSRRACRHAGQFTLLAPKLAPEMAFWVGPQPTLEQLAQESGADRWGRRRLPQLTRGGRAPPGTGPQAPAAAHPRCGALVALVPAQRLALVAVPAHPPLLPPCWRSAMTPPLG
jgi:hypothetical protein